LLARNPLQTSPTAIYQYYYAEDIYQYNYVFRSYALWLQNGHFLIEALVMAAGLLESLSTES